MIIEKLELVDKNGISTVKLGNEELNFDSSAPVYGIYCFGKLVGVWQRAWHEAHILRKDNQVVSIARTYKNQPIPLHLELVELGTDKYFIVYRIENKNEEMGFIPVSRY